MTWPALDTPDGVSDAVALEQDVLRQTISACRCLTRETSKRRGRMVWLTLYFNS